MYKTSLEIKKIKNKTPHSITSPVYMTSSLAYFSIETNLVQLKSIKILRSFPVGCLHLNTNTLLSHGGSFPLLFFSYSIHTSIWIVHRFVVYVTSYNFTSSNLKTIEIRCNWVTDDFRLRVNVFRTVAIRRYHDSGYCAFCEFVWYTIVLMLVKRFIYIENN